MSYCKFYVMLFKNKVYKKPNDNKRMIKFGITHHSDALRRFDETVDDGYKKDYSDWEIKVLYSQNFFGPSAWVYGEELERYCLFDKFPPNTHKVWVEDYLNVENKRKYDNSGITEIRLLTSSEIDDVLKELKSGLSEEELRLKAERRKKLEEQAA